MQGSALPPERELKLPWPINGPHRLRTRGVKEKSQGPKFHESEGREEAVSRQGDHPSMQSGLFS